MITAKEARKALNNKNKSEQEQELKMIESAIIRAIQENENCIITSRPLYQENIDILKEKGYKLKYKLGFLFTDPHWEIIW